MVRDKRGKFVELIEARVNRTVRDIRLIGNLSNRSAYTYTDDDVRKVFRALQKEIDAAKARFGGGGSSKEEGFRLE
jgi:hypothetical protein